MNKSTTNLHLDARLGTAYGMIPKGCRVADIGCDHGKLAVALANKCSTVIAIDKCKAPLEKAKAACTGLCNVECRLGDGLFALRENEVDYAIIGGLSAETICNILFSSNNTQCRFVLIPASRDSHLRKALYLHGYKIEKEHIAKAAQRLYTVILASYTGKVIRKNAYFCIRGIANGENVREYLIKCAKVLEKRILGENASAAKRTRVLISKLLKEADENV